MSAQPTPSPASDPLADFPKATISAWFASKHNYHHTEAVAATALSSWLSEHGISLAAANTTTVGGVVVYGPIDDDGEEGEGD